MCVCSFGLIHFRQFRSLTSFQRLRELYPLCPFVYIGIECNRAIERQHCRLLPRRRHCHRHRRRCTVLSIGLIIRVCRVCGRADVIVYFAGGKIIRSKLLVMWTTRVTWHGRDHHDNDQRHRQGDHIFDHRYPPAARRLSPRSSAVTSARPSVSTNSSIIKDAHICSPPQHITPT